MKNTSKILSVFLCLSLLVSFLPTFSTTLSAETDGKSYPIELVENGNFSDGSTTLSSQWSGVDTSLEITDGGKYLGLYCLKATPNTTGGTAKANLTLKAKPNTQYLLHVSTSSGWKNFNYYVNDKAISLTDTATQEVSTERSNVTTKNNNIQTSLFTSPEDGNVTVTFWYDGIFEIDRVYVTEYGTDMNIDFSNGKIGNHYVSNGGSTKTVNTIETEGSNKYLKVHNNNNNWEMGPVFYAATVPGNNYKITFDINTTSRWAVFYITNSIWGNNAGIAQVAISEKLTDSDCGKWKTIEAEFTATTYFTTFGFKLSNNLSALCLDNISFKDNSEIPTELVENGNFSDGSTTLSSQWSGVDTSLEITDGGKYLGLYCLKATPNTTGGTAKANLTLKAKPNTQYLLHVSTSSGWKNFNYYVNDKAISLTDTATQEVSTERSNVTTKNNNIQTSLFTSPEDGNVTVTFWYDGIFEIDRVYVTEYGTDMNIDFSNGKIGNHYVSNGGSTKTVNTIETEGSNKYLKVHNNNNNWEMGPVFYAATVPGNNYKITFDINTTSRWAVFYITNSIWGNNAGIAQVAISEKLTDSDCGKWKTIEAEFTAKSYYTTFGFKPSGSLQALCIDNFSLKKAATVSAVAQEGGEVFGGAGYAVGDAVTLTAVNKSGYDFTGWYKGDKLVSNDAVYSFTAAGDAEYTAHFTPSKNLFANTSFETGDINWTLNSAYGPYLWGKTTNWGRVSVSEDAHTGKYAIRFTSKSTGDTNGQLSLIKQTAGLETDTDYLLAFWVKFDNGENAETADAAYKINSGSGVIKQGSMDCSKTDWTHYTVLFNSGSDTTATIEFLGALSNYVIDDVVLIKNSGGIICDGSFDGGDILGWKYNTGLLTVDTEHAVDSYSVKMNGNGTDPATLTVSVEPETAYEFSFKVSRAANATSNFKFNVYSGVGDTLYSSLANELSTSAENDGFATVRSVFRSAVDSVTIELCGNGVLWFDDFSVTEYTCTGDANLDGEIDIADLVRVKKCVSSDDFINNKFAGDINNNGEVNSDDFSSLRLALLDPAYEPEQPTQTVSRYSRIMNEDGMVYGINIPWFTSAAQGHNLSSGTLTGYPASFNYRTAYNTLYNCKEIGFNAVNIWLFAGFDGIAFDEDLKATGLKTDFVKNLTSVLEIAEELDLGLTFTVQPHIDTMANEAYAGSGAETYKNYFKIISDATKRSAYMEKAVKPVFDLIKQYNNNIVSIVTYCEPELEYISEYTKNAGNTDEAAIKSTLKTFITEISTISKQALPGVPVGLTLCSYLHDADYRDLQTNGNLDYIGYDHYNSDGSVPDITDKGDTWLIECGLTTASSDENYSTALPQFLENAKSQGYKAVYYWSYDSDTTAIVDFSNEHKYQAVGNIYKYIRDQRANKGLVSAEKLITPKVLLDQKYVVFLGAKNGTYYQIHRYDQDSKAWAYDKVEFGGNTVIGVYETAKSAYYRVSNIEDGNYHSVIVPYKY